MDNQVYVSSANRACSLLYNYIKKHAKGIWLLPVNVCPDIPFTFGLAGATFQFVDINPCTLCIDIEDIVRKLKSSSQCYEGIVYVRTYGILKDTSEDFRRIKNIRNGIIIIDDRCLCVPEFNPDFYGSDMVLYSTGRCKQIDLGGGGLAFTKTPTPYEIDQSLIYNGTDEEYIYKKAFKEGKTLQEMPQGWLKMDNYKPLLHYKEIIRQSVKERETIRIKLNSIYAQKLPSTIQLKSGFQDWRFNITVPRSLKKIILDKLFENNLFASSHYHSVNRLFNGDSYPISDGLFESVINLFNDNYYSESKAIRTCDIINMVMNSNSHI